MDYWPRPKYTRVNHDEARGENGCLDFRKHPPSSSDRCLGSGARTPNGTRSCCIARDQSQYDSGCLQAPGHCWYCNNRRTGTFISPAPPPAEQEGSPPDTPLIDLAGGNPDVAWLPDIAQVMAQRPYRPRLYGAPTLDDELEAIRRDWMNRDCPEEFQLNLTNGAVDAVERLLSAYLVSGDSVAV